MTDAEIDEWERNNAEENQRLIDLKEERKALEYEEMIRDRDDEYYENNFLC